MARKPDVEYEERKVTSYRNPGNLTHGFQLEISSQVWAGYCMCGEVLGWRYPQDGYDATMWESLYRRHMWSVSGKEPEITGYQTLRKPKRR